MHALHKVLLSVIGQLCVKQQDLQDGFDFVCHYRAHTNFCHAFAVNGYVKEDHIPVNDSPQVGSIINIPK